MPVSHKNHGRVPVLSRPHLRVGRPLRLTEAEIERLIEATQDHRYSQSGPLAAETGGPVQVGSVPGSLRASVSIGASARADPALRASSSFGKKLQSRVAPSYYLESLLCNAPTEAFSNKRSRA